MNTNKENNEGFFDTIEMQEILEFIDHENEKVIDEEKLDQIAKAWDKVERKKLYNN